MFRSPPQLAPRVRPQKNRCMPQTIVRSDTDRALAFPRPSSRGSADLLQQAAELVPMGAWSCDLNTDELTWTPGVFDLFGVPRHIRVDRRDMLEMYGEESRDALERLRAHAIRTRTGFTLDARIIRPDGKEKWMRLTAATRVSNNRAVELYGMKQDITAERHQWDSLRRLAECDPLTGIGNRALFQSRFLAQPKDAHALGPLGSLVLFDMDDFKAINDQWGHVAGDACLKIFAQRLKAAFPQALLIARIGGDEFAVLFAPGTSQMAMEAAVRSQMPALLAPALWKDEVLPMGVSVGMAFTDEPTAFDPEELFMAADEALYFTKRNRKNVRRSVGGELSEQMRRVVGQ